MNATFWGWGGHGARTRTLASIFVGEVRGMREFSFAA